MIFLSQSRMEARLIMNKHKQMQRGSMASSQIGVITTIFSKCLFSLVNKFDSVDNSWSSFFDFHKDIGSRWSVFLHFWIQTDQLSRHPFYRDVNFAVRLLNVAPYLLPCSVFCQRNISLNFSNIFCVFNSKIREEESQIAAKRAFFAHTSQVPALTTCN